MEQPEDEKLEKAFAILRGPEKPPGHEELTTAWPDLVERARAEADRRKAPASRWKLLLGGLAVAASLFVAAGVLHFKLRPDGPGPGPDVAKGPNIPTWPGDLTRSETFEACCKAVNATEAQRAAMSDLAMAAVSYQMKLPVSASEADHRAVHDDLRKKIAALLDPEQRKRFEAFCAERDKK